MAFYVAEFAKNFVRFFYVAELRKKSSGMVRDTNQPARGRLI